MSTGIVFIGRYRLINPVYMGATTQLWQGIFDGTGEQFAVKFLQEKFRKDRAQIGYLKWEYTVGSQFHDEHLIRVVEFGTHRGIPFLAMEWFAGSNMKVLIRQGIDAYAHLAKRIIFQAVEAVAYLHRQGYVHRDIKPENFLVGQSGEVKLIDFALCRRISNPLVWLLSPKTKIQGTCSYISPEQIQNRRLDGRADLYSLACTIYELLSGRPPFTGINQAELLNRHLKAAAPPIESINPNITPQFSQLLQKALAKRPADRFQSVAEFYGLLHDVEIFKERPAGEVSPIILPGV